MPPPDRWEEYSAIGGIIPGTRIFAFKVPLKEGLCRNLPEDQKFTPTQAIEAVEKQGRQLGLVIDLTFTTKYYHNQEFLDRSVEYVKVFTAGHHVPCDDVVKRFFDAVDSFFEKNGQNEMVLGVHCTHGVNRTGYVVCRYMIDKLGFKAAEAIDAFNEARGHSIERENYLADLHKRPDDTIVIKAVGPAHGHTNNKWNTFRGQKRDRSSHHDDEVRENHSYANGEYREQDYDRNSEKWNPRSRVEDDRSYARPSSCRYDRDLREDRRHREHVRHRRRCVDQPMGVGEYNFGMWSRQGIRPSYSRNSSNGSEGWIRNIEDLSLDRDSERRPDRDSDRHPYQDGQKSSIQEDAWRNDQCISHNNEPEFSCRNYGHDETSRNSTRYDSNRDDRHKRSHHTENDQFAGHMDGWQRQDLYYGRGRGHWQRGRQNNGW